MVRVHLSHHRTVTRLEGRTSCSLCPSHVIASSIRSHCVPVLSIHRSYYLLSAFTFRLLSLPYKSAAWRFRLLTCAVVPAQRAHLLLGDSYRTENRRVSVFTVARGSTHYTPRKYSVFDSFHQPLFFEHGSAAAGETSSPYSLLNRCCRSHKVLSETAAALSATCRYLSHVTHYSSLVLVWWGLRRKKHHRIEITFVTSRKSRVLTWHFEM